MIGFNEYQNEAAAFGVYRKTLPANQWQTYTALGLTGEAGEVAEKHKKYLRDGGNPVDVQAAVKKELGDVLWYVAQNAREWGLSLQEIADANLEKLASRKERGTLHGSGDNR